MSGNLSEPSQFRFSAFASTSMRLFLWSLLLPLETRNKKPNMTTQTNQSLIRERPHKEPASASGSSLIQLIDFKALCGLWAHDVVSICMRTYIIAESRFSVASARGAQPTLPLCSPGLIQVTAGHQQLLKGTSGRGSQKDVLQGFSDTFTAYRLSSWKPDTVHRWKQYLHELLDKETWKKLFFLSGFQ